MHVSVPALYVQDKNEMVVHHCVTISLIFFSWACNFVRVGTLVLVVHDIADPWMAVSTVKSITLNLPKLKIQLKFMQLLLVMFLLTSAQTVVHAATLR